MAAVELARHLGVEFQRPPTSLPVVAGYAALTPLGNTEQTRQGLYEGRSGVQKFDVRNPRTSIAAPVEFNPNNHFTPQEQRILPRITQMAIVLAREAAANAGISGEDGKVKPELRHRTACWIGTGIGPTQHLIDVYNTIHHSKDKEENELPSEVGAGRIRPWDGLLTFPEEINGQVAMYLGCQGWGGTTAEACATGLSNIVEGARLIRDGYADIVICGGGEEALAHHGDVGIGIFAGMRSVLSTRNDHPEAASRPFDKDRDGFVLASGMALTVLMREDLADKMRIEKHAKVARFVKSMDGSDPTSLDPNRVAATMAEARCSEDEELAYHVDAYFAHATATKLGDREEMKALKMVFTEEELRELPITAIKSELGHMAGGAGSINFLAGVWALEDGKIPPIRNLDDVEKTDEFKGLQFVRGQALEKNLTTVLVHASGFGGHNADALLVRADREPTLAA